MRLPTALTILALIVIAMLIGLMIGVSVVEPWSFLVGLVTGLLLRWLRGAVATRGSKTRSDHR